MFAHLVSEEGELVAQVDAQPFNGLYPTSAWATNHVVAHNVVLSIPGDIMPGKYTVRLGWYTWPLLERLAITAIESNIIDNALILTTIEIEGDSSVVPLGLAFY
jgi:hypothetical protein